MKVKHPASTDALSAEDEALLRFGPGPPDYREPSIAEHDRLRIVWATHGEAIRASMPRTRRGRLQLPWFVERDWFVRVVRGESCTDRPR